MSLAWTPAIGGEGPVTARPELLRAEWERIELLSHCLAEARRGQQAGSEAISRLETLQSEVQRIRPEAWRVVEAPDLAPYEYDLLACAVAPEAEPRLGWLFQSLQPGAPQPYPTPALVHDLLAMDAVEANALYVALGEEGTLRRRNLVRMDGEDPFQPIRPGPGIAARLLGRREADAVPPGAVRVTVRATWDDLVLPPSCLAMLRELILWVRHRRTVVQEWGGGEVGGPIALFAGPSGTGKTFASSVLAAELGWPLYRVDLGQLVSKYVGETEKNLNRLFDAAHGRPMVLQFDEADSLFGKRGEIKEARDRYANLEVNHLLARIEAHRGPCILTTNLRKNLDPAFARRFQVVIDFPRPDAESRARLWSRLLPPRAPRTAEVDPGFLGRTANLTGGGIRNAALHAAYLAAGAGTPITLEHVTLAVWRELGKDGRELTRGDLGALARYLPE
ncbi:MAG TPA: ATP-binding protein [Thermoanaerobaculia bacterium]|nr:ATP-binding protein [Thermoanaerobaculia bacterium]